MTDKLTPEFKVVSTRSALRALRRLEPTAKMLETYAPDIFPEKNEAGQIHFGRAMMEAAASAIRFSWASAIKEIEAFSLHEGAQAEFMSEDFDEVAKGLRHGDEAFVRAAISNNLNVIIAALDIASNVMSGATGYLAGA